MACQVLNMYVGSPRYEYTFNHTINQMRNGMNDKSFYILCASIMRTGYCGRYMLPF